MKICVEFDRLISDGAAIMTQRQTLYGPTQDDLQRQISDLHAFDNRVRIVGLQNTKQDHDCLLDSGKYVNFYQWVYYTTFGGLSERQLVPSCF